MRDVEVRMAKLEKLLANADVTVPTEEILPRGEYIRLQADLMLLAFQMGITNISTFMIGPERWDATLMYEGVFDKPVQHHNMTHNQKGNGYLELAKIDTFHMQQYAYMIQRMKEIKESDGSTMLDNSLITYGAALGDGATHQFYDLPMIVAGGTQGQIKQGRFIRMKSGTLNSNLWLTLANLMGLEMESFADSHGVLLRSVDVIHSMKNNRMRLGVSLLVFALSWLPTKADDEFQEKLQPLFAQHCVKCHGGDKVKGKVNLKEIGNARQFLGKPALIKELIDVLTPATCRRKTSPAQAGGPRRAAHHAQGHAPHRRLRPSSQAQSAPATEPFQYNNAVRDLFQLNRNVFALSEN